MNYEEQFITDFADALRHKSPRFRNGYDGARVDRLTASWQTAYSSGDVEMRSGLRILRARVRDLDRNNPFVKKYHDMVVMNILGQNGIGFQSKVKDTKDQQDVKANTLIEAKFADWGNRKNSPDVTGRYSWKGIKRLVLRTVARDGECLVRLIRNFPNKYRFAVQVLEADFLDEYYNSIWTNGNEIRMSVEIDEWRRPVAYWLRSKNPADYGFPYQVFNKRAYVRIPAEDILHVYKPDRPNDTRSVPWSHASIVKLQMLAGYEEAELVASRVSAAKMGVITSPDGEYNGDLKDETGQSYMEAEPGTFPVLPEGYSLTSFDPQHPAGNFPPFTKAMIRSASAGMGVSYNSIANDLEGVNYSSIRAGLIEERDNWRILQDWFVEDFCDPIMREWLKMLLMLPGIPYSFTDFERLHAPKWVPRAWDWVDPLKDIASNVEALNAGLTTRTQIAAEGGEDFEEDILKVLQKEKELAEKYGVSFSTAKPAATPASVGAEDVPVKPTASFPAVWNMLTDEDRAVLISLHGGNNHGS